MPKSISRIDTLNALAIANALSIPMLLGFSSQFRIVVTLTSHAAANASLLIPIAFRHSPIDSFFDTIFPPSLYLQLEHLFDIVSLILSQNKYVGFGFVTSLKNFLCVNVPFVCVLV